MSLIKKVTLEIFPNRNVTTVELMDGRTFQDVQILESWGASTEKFESAELESVIGERLLEAIQDLSGYDVMRAMNNEEVDFW